MLDLQETSEVVRFMLHEPDEAPIDRFGAVSAITLVLELTLLVSIELVLIHWQSQAIDQ